MFSFSPDVTIGAPFIYKWRDIIDRVRIGRRSIGYGVKKGVGFMRLCHVPYRKLIPMCFFKAVELIECGNWHLGPSVLRRKRC